MSVRFDVIIAISGSGQLQAVPMARMQSMSSCGWNPYAAARSQPHEAWRVLVDNIHGEGWLTLRPAVL